MSAVWFPRQTVFVDRLTRLLLDAQGGDRRALEQFVAETEHDVRVLCRYLGDSDNHDDLAQEAYERAFRSLHRYRADGPAKHWLLTIARRACVDATRKRSRRRAMRRQLVDEHGADTIESPNDAFRAEWTELLDTLDPDRRAAFVITQINGLRYDEAADVLGVPIGTIRSRVARAREQLIGSIEAGERAANGEPDEPLRRPGT